MGQGGHRWRSTPILSPLPLGPTRRPGVLAKHSHFFSWVELCFCSACPKHSQAIKY